MPHMPYKAEVKKEGKTSGIGRQVELEDTPVIFAVDKMIDHFKMPIFSSLVEHRTICITNYTRTVGINCMFNSTVLLMKLIHVFLYYSLHVLSTGMPQNIVQQKNKTTIYTSTYTGIVDITCRAAMQGTWVF